MWVGAVKRSDSAKARSIMAPVIADLGELVGMGEQVAQERGQGLLDGLAAGEHHEHGGADDRVVGHVAGASASMAEQPVRWRFGDERAQIGVEFVPGGQAGRS